MEVRRIKTLLKENIARLNEYAEFIETLESYSWDKINYYENLTYLTYKDEQELSKEYKMAEQLYSQYIKTINISDILDDALYKIMEMETDV